MSYVYLLPVAVFLLFQVTFIATYIVAVASGHVVPTVPYISDAATYSPESCIFGQLINFGAVLLGLTVYVRYRHVKHLYEIHPELNRVGLKCNKTALYFGLISAIGVSVVANFQETNVRFVHYLGAFCSFGCGTAYFWLQSQITYILLPVVGSKIYAHLRVFMSLFCTIFFIAQAVTGLLSHIYFKGDNPRKWYPSDGGWGFHVASSISEWIVATFFCFYILSFTDEFREVGLGHPEVRVLTSSMQIVNTNDDESA